MEYLKHIESVDELALTNHLNYLKQEIKLRRPSEQKEFITGNGYFEYTFFRYPHGHDAEQQLTIKEGFDEFEGIRKITYKFDKNYIVVRIYA